MKKILSGILVGLFAIVLLFGAPIAALAQETTTVTVLGIEIDVTAVDAIVALLAGALVTLVVQFLKAKIKFVAEGVGAFVFTVLSTYAVTAVYFLVINPMHPWVWLKYLVYGAAVLGESTGYFHLYKKVSGTPSTPAT